MPDCLKSLLVMHRQLDLLVSLLHGVRSPLSGDNYEVILHNCNLVTVRNCMNMNDFKNGYNVVYMIMEMKILLHMSAI